MRELLVWGRVGDVWGDVWGTPGVDAPYAESDSRRVGGPEIDLRPHACKGGEGGRAGGGGGDERDGRRGGSESESEREQYIYIYI